MDVAASLRAELDNAKSALAEAEADEALFREQNAWVLASADEKSARTVILKEFVRGIEKTVERVNLFSRTKVDA